MVACWDYSKALQVTKDSQFNLLLIKNFMIKIVYDLIFYKHKSELSTSKFGPIYNRFYNLAL